MKYIILFLISLSLVNCSLRPTDQEIDEAARRQLKNKEICQEIAQSLDAVSDFRKQNGEWSCLVYKKTYLDNPWAIFSEADLAPVRYYLYFRK